MPKSPTQQLQSKQQHLKEKINILRAKLATLDEHHDSKPLASLTNPEITSRLLDHLNDEYRCKLTNADMPHPDARITKTNIHPIFNIIRENHPSINLNSLLTETQSFVRFCRPHQKPQPTKTPQQLQNLKKDIEIQINLLTQDLDETTTKLDQAKATAEAEKKEREEAKHTRKAAARARKAAQLKKNRAGEKDPAKATQPDRTDNSLTPDSIDYGTPTQMIKPIEISAFQLLTNPLNNLGIISSAYGTTPCMIIIVFRLILLISKFTSTKIHNLMRPGRDSITLLQILSLPIAIIMQAQNKAHKVPDTLCLFSIAFLCVTHLVCRMQLKNAPMNQVVAMKLKAKFIHALLTVSELAVLFLNTELFTPGGEYQTKMVAPTAHT